MPLNGGRDLGKVAKQGKNMQISKEQRRRESTLLPWRSGTSLLPTEFFSPTDKLKMTQSVPQKWNNVMKNEA